MSPLLLGTESLRFISFDIDYKMSRWAHMYTVQYVLCTVCVEYISNFVDGKSKYLRNLMALFKFHELLAKTGSERVWYGTNLPWEYHPHSLRNFIIRKPESGIKQWHLWAKLCITKLSTSHYGGPEGGRM